MEYKLKKLFDYQRFAGNTRLQAAIDSVRKQARQLIPDDAEQVSAAGAPYRKPALDNEKESRL